MHADETQNNSSLPNLSTEYLRSSIKQQAKESEKSMQESKKFENSNTDTSGGSQETSPLPVQFDAGYNTFGNVIGTGHGRELN